MKPLIPFFLLVIFAQKSYAQLSDSLQNNLNEVLISANKFDEKLRDVPRQIDIIDSKKIIQLNKQNTADLLQETGNISIQKSQQGGGSIILRGFEANRVLLVVDGVRLNNAIYRSGHLHNVLRIDQQMLERIEIIYGPGSLIYGSDALGGVVHFVSKKPKLNQSLGGGINSRFSLVNNEFTNSLNIAAGYKKWAWLASLTSSSFGDLRQGKNRNPAIGKLGERNSFQARVGDTDRVIKNEDPSLQVGSAYKQIDAMGKIFFQSKSKQTHLLNLQFSNTSNIPRYDRLTEYTNDTPNSAQWFYGPELRTMASYQFEDTRIRKIYERIRITTAYQYIEESRNNRNFNKDNSNPNNNNNFLNKRNEYVNIGTLNIDAFKNYHKHEIRYGAEFTYNKVQSHALAENVLTGITKAISTRYPDGGSHMQTIALYISHSHEFGSKLILTQGVRISAINLESNFKNKAFFSFLPDRLKQQNMALCGSLGLVFLPTEKVKLYFNTANAFRAPNVEDLTKIFDSKTGSILIVPNENLKSEQSWTSEVGSNLVIVKNLNLEANIYYTRLWNAIVVDKAKVNGVDSLIYDGTITAVSMNQNVQAAYIYGFQFNLKYIVFKNCVAQSGINYTYGSILSNPLKPLDHIPPMFGRISITYYAQKWQLSFYSLYSAAKELKDYNINGEDNLQYATADGMPAWYTLNVQGSYLLTKNQKATLQAGIENIMDTNYRTFASGMSAAGRNVWFSLRLKI
ncbi:MAG: TonB-dependent receptor [Bacteroidota bacterium]|nr:TonB-dependent receptor [Bacteroidota bacterium]